MPSVRRGGELPESGGMDWGLPQERAVHCFDPLQGPERQKTRRESTENQGVCCPSAFCAPGLTE